MASKTNDMGVATSYGSFNQHSTRKVINFQNRYLRRKHFNG